MRDQLRSRLARNAGWMFLGQGVSFAVQACYFVLLARLLGADQYGIFVGAAAAVSLLSQYSTLGSGLVLVRQVSRDNSEFPLYWGNMLVTVGECTCTRIAEVSGQAFQAFEQLKLTALLTSLTSVARLLAAAGMML